MRRELTWVLLFGTLLSWQSEALGQRWLRQVRDDLSDVKNNLSRIKNDLSEVKTRIDVLEETIEDNAKAVAAVKQQLIKLNALNKLISQTDSRIDKLHQRISAEADSMKEVKTAVDKLASRFWGQIRVRPQFETNRRDFRSEFDEDQDMFVTQRVRLGFQTQLDKLIDIKLVLQDARTFGVNYPGKDKSDPMRLHEGYVKFHIARDSVYLKIGRQQWSYGGERMIGANDWEQSARAFDGLVFGLTYDNYLRLNLLGSILDERNASDGKDLLFGGVYAVVPYWDVFDLDFYVLYLHDPRRGAVRKIWTTGLRAAGAIPSLESLFFDVELTYQFGTAAEGKPEDRENLDNPHRAAAYYLEAGYKLPVDYSPTISAFFLWASGDGNTSPKSPDNTQHTSFVPLFPTKHLILGKMDMFEMYNIQDIGGRLGVKPTNELGLGCDIHYMSIVLDTAPVPTSSVPAPSLTKASRTDLGLEVDLYANWKILQNFVVSAGYSFFLPGGAIRDQIYRDVQEEVEDPDNPGQTKVETYRYEGGDPAHWVWLQGNVLF